MIRIHKQILGRIDSKSLSTALLAAALLPGLGFSADKLTELKRRKLELDQMQAECEAKSDPDRAECLEKRAKKVEKYRSDLQAFKADVAKDESRRSASDQGSNVDLNARIVQREASIRNFLDYVNSCQEKSERCATSLFQVAQLSFQNEEDGFLVKQQKYEKEFAAWEDRDRRGAEPVAPKRNHAASLKHFERFLKEYPNHKDAAAALYRGAYIHDVMGNDDRSFEFLTTLATRFPSSGLAIPTHLRLGEYWLMKRKYAKAIEEYEKVPVNYPGNEASLALYHKAEAFYNMADFENAARYYFQYVDLSDKGKLKGDFRDEALQFMAASWADLDNGFEIAERFLGDHGNPSWSQDIYFEIGAKNKAHDRLDESVKAFRFLLDRNPAYPRAPIADMNIVEILVIQKKAEEAQQARMDLVARYSPDSEWHRRNAGNKEVFADAQKAIKMAMYQIPVYYHAKGEEGKGDTEMLRNAEMHYRRFLERYSNEDSWDIYVVHQNLAIVYSRLKEFGNAAKEYEWCANAPTNKFGKLPSDKKDVISTQDAGYNAVVMLDENRKKALEELKGDKAAAYNSAETEQYFTGVGRYMSRFGKSENAPEIAYNAAFVHYEAKQFKRAIQSLKSLSDNFPNHKHTTLIKRALAQSYLEDGQLEDAQREFVALLNRTPPSDKAYGDIRKALAGVYFKQGDERAKRGDFSGAAQKYLECAQRFRDVEEIADKALFEAGVNLDQAGRTDEGVAKLVQIAQMPKSPLRVKAVLRGADIYQKRKQWMKAGNTFLLVQQNFPNDSMGILSLGWAAEAYEKVPDLNLAARTYESAHRLYGKDPKTPSFVYNAGQIYETAKNYDDALRVYRILGDNYPKSPYSIEAVFSVPIILERKGDYARAAESYENFVKQYAGDLNKSIRAHLGAGKNYEKLGNDQKALNHFSAVVQVYSKAGEKDMVPTAIPAEAAYRAGEIYYQKILRVRLDGSKAQNQARVKDMQANLAPAISHFAKAAELAEEEWTLRATMRMGDLFYTLAKISENERIHAKSADEQIAERVQTKVAVPAYLDKARELYQKNLDLARNQVIESPYVDTTGMRFMESYWMKAQAFEDIGKILSQAPIPKELKGEDRDQYKAALEDKAFEASRKAQPIYKEALRAAQYYALEGEPKRLILARLRELEPEAEELTLVAAEKPRKPLVQTSTGSAGSIDNRDGKYESNMKRIAKIYDNESLSEDQKVELLLQIEADARREINDLSTEIGANSNP